MTTTLWRRGRAAPYDDRTGRRGPAAHRKGPTVLRTHEAGTLRADHAGQTVVLAGWVARRRDHGGVAFLDLRDASGVVQVVVRDAETAHGLRAEYCVQVTGEVAVRPAGNENPDLPTGAVEVVTTGLDVLSEAAPLPFQIDDHVEVGEEARLRYRYLDLRRTAPAEAIRLRSEVNRAARDVLLERRFVEIETPTLTRSTPEGARDFLVPARLRPGSWYALPQSPQLFKQLLMVAGTGALLPDRPLLPGRGLPRRPAAGVHPARHRDELRRAGRRPRARRGGRQSPVGPRRLRHPAASAAPDLRGVDEPVRLRQARPALQPGAHRLHRLLRGDRVPGVPGALRRCRGDARRRFAAAQAARRVAGLGQAARSARARVRPGRRGRRARRPRGQEPQPTTELAGLASHVGANPGDCVFFAAGTGEVLAGTARRRTQRDRSTLWPDRRVGVVVPVGDRRAVVRAGVGRGGQR